MIGGALGAYVLSNINAATAKPFILAYLAAIGLYLLWRAQHYPPHERSPKIVEPLGLAGGFLDAAGGGGWGPVVTSNLLVQGAEPRRTIGTVNTAEFFLTVTISATFIAMLGWQVFTATTIALGAAATLVLGVIPGPLLDLAGLAGVLLDPLLAVLLPVGEALLVHRPRVGGRDVVEAAIRGAVDGTGVVRSRIQISKFGLDLVWAGRIRCAAIVRSRWDPVTSTTTPSVATPKSSGVPNSCSPFR